MNHQILKQNYCYYHYHKHCYFYYLLFYLFIAIFFSTYSLALVVCRKAPFETSQTVLWLPSAGLVIKKPNYPKTYGRLHQKK